MRLLWCLAMLAAVAEWTTHPIGATCWLVALVLIAYMAHQWRGRLFGKRHSAACRVRARASGHSAELIARHEAGHVAVARAVGGTGIRVRVWPNGGWTHADNIPSVTAHLAFLLGGEYATGTGTGCGGDRDAARKVLRDLPSNERSAARREAERIARRAISGAGGAIQRDTVRIVEKRRL